MNTSAPKFAALSPAEKRQLLGRALEKKAGPRTYPVSFSQQRLWFLDQLTPGNPFYNTAIAVRIRAPMFTGVLEKTINEIVRRHETLRTTFSVVDGEPRQIVAPALAIPLRYVDLRALPAAEAEAEAVRLAREDADLPFDLACGPLLRTSLLQLKAADFVFLLTQHHIISDGWSMGIFARELTTLYTAFAMQQRSPLPELALQYGDFAVWQRNWLQGEALQEQLGYWKAQLADAPALRLPTDRPRPAMQSYRGATHFFQMPAALATALQRLSKAEGATLFMTLLTGFKALLHRYTQQDDLVVGSYIANRNRAEVESIIGFFV
ncbi:MAG TPA: condensation domain-containing protein, partial [Chthoniobacteraceae bacterium]|nr:condensation domain-containing protein [Chthoniobacteraceae bacterium]